MFLFFIKVVTFQTSLGSETSDMTSRGLGEMFEGDSAENFRYCRWGAERRVSRAQTRERGPTSVLVEILNN